LDGRFTGREPDHDYEVDCDFYVAMNAWHEVLKFRIPASPTRRRWRRVVDTGRPGPDDFVTEGEGPVITDGSYYAVAPHARLALGGEPCPRCPRIGRVRVCRLPCLNPPPCGGGRRARRSRDRRVGGGEKRSGPPTRRLALLDGDLPLKGGGQDTVTDG